MTPIRTNKPVFFDVDDSVLEGGQIYIGQPSTDPRTNAKTVTFVDSGGSGFTASQPLKTKAGRIVYNGKPIEATVDGEYSMLILNSSGVQVDYSPSVNSEASAATGLSETIRVGLVLNDIKAFDVAVGDVVRNVGNASATDDGGADWLAISNTGSAGDDVDLIDFDNGLQGQRYTTNPVERVETISLGGDFTAPNDRLTISKIGNVVTVTCPDSGLEHASLSTPNSAAGAIPEWARPQSLVKAIYGFSVPGPYIVACSIVNNGNFSLTYLNSSFGGQANTSSSGLTISYVV